MAHTSTRPVTGLIGGRAATMDDYEQLFRREHRPEKFSEKEVNLIMAEPGMPTCSECWHFYINVLSKRTVCEIVRRRNEENISPHATCRFNTQDGSHYPLLEVL